MEESNQVSASVQDQMTQWHNNYMYSKVWNKDEVESWMKITNDCIHRLTAASEDQLEDVMADMIENQLKPLALAVVTRFVMENKIVDGLEHVAHLVFCSPVHVSLVSFTDGDGNTFSKLVQEESSK